MQTLSLSEAKAQLSQLIDAVEHTHDAVTITRHGRPAAVLVSADALEQLTDSIEWLSDPSHDEELAEAERDIDEQRTLTVDDARMELRRGRR